MAANKLVLEITVDDKGSPVVKQFGETVAQAGGKAQTAAGQAGSSWQSAAMGMNQALELVRKAFDALLRPAVDWAAGSIAAAMTAEAENAKLAAVIRATGGAAGFTSAQLQEMAGRLQNLVSVDDEVIKGGMSILATFRNIKGEAFEGATKAALDMAAVMGQDLKSSMLQVGKAMNDPAEGLDALTRSGVQFTEAQKLMIKEMAYAGNVAGAQKIILKELADQFGGAASASADTFGGKLRGLALAYGDLREELGAAVTDNNAFIEAMTALKEILVGATTDAQDNKQALREMAKSGLLLVVDAIAGVVIASQVLQDMWNALKIVGALAWTGFITVIKGAFMALQLLLRPIDLLMEGLVKLGAIDKNPFTSMAETIEEMRLASLDAGASIVADAEKTHNSYQPVIDKLADVRGRIEATAATSRETTDKVVAHQTEQGVAIAATVEQLKSQAAARKAIDAAYIQSMERDLALQLIMVKQSGANESAVIAQTAAGKTAIIEESYTRSVALIAAEAAARTAEERHKLSDAKFTADRIAALDAESVAKRAAILQEYVAQSYELENKRADATRQAYDLIDQAAGNSDAIRTRQIVQMVAKMAELGVDSEVIKKAVAAQELLWNREDATKALDGLSSIISGLEGYGQKAVEIEIAVAQKRFETMQQDQNLKRAAAAMGIDLAQVEADTIDRILTKQMTARLDCYKQLGIAAEEQDALIKELAEREYKRVLELTGNIKAAEKAKTKVIVDENLERAASSDSFFDGLTAAYSKDLNAQKSWGQKGIDVYKQIDEAKTSIIDKGVNAFLRGEDAKKAIQQAAGDAIVSITGRYATEAYNAAIGKTISLIGAYIGEGAGKTGAKAASGGVWAAIGEIGLYLGSAVAAMLGGRALAEQFRAEGGWIGSHPNGGIIMQGSGLRDDVYLGRTEHTRHWGMGGEFVVNKEQTAKYADLLIAINSGHMNRVTDTGYAAGGYYGSKGQELAGDPDALALEMAAGGQLCFGVAFGRALAAGSDIYSAIGSGIGETATYIGTACGSVITGKGLSSAFMEDGGPIRDMGHFNWGGFLGTLFIPPGFPNPFAGGRIVIGPGITFNMNPAEIWQATLDWINEQWKNFLESQKAGWRNYAEVVLTPGDMSMDVLAGLNNELSAFGNHLKSVTYHVLKPPGVNFPAEEDLASGGYIPGYADGGSHRGGWRLVGELGPELEYTGPSRIYSTPESKSLVDNSDVVAEIRALNGSIEGLRSDFNKIGFHILTRANKTGKTIEGWTVPGALPVRVAVQ